MATASPALPTKAAPDHNHLNQKVDTLWVLAWRRLRRNKLAMLGLGIIVFFVLLAIFGGFIIRQDPLKFNSGKDYLPPIWVAESSGKTYPNPDYIFGTDSGGRDLFARIVLGARVSVFVAIIPTIIILFIGVPLGMLTGFFGGWSDNIIMRVVDILEAFPDILFFIVLSVALRETAFGQAANGLLLLFFALAIVSWGGIARLVRGGTLSLRTREFVDAARSQGMPEVSIVFKHILPNVTNTIIVWAALAMPRYIIAEATLAYLGLGMRSPTSMTDSFFLTSWGQIINEGRTSLNIQPWGLLIPAMCIALIVVGVTFFGNGLRDALDPRQMHKPG